MTSLSDRLAALCVADGEFRMAARYWTGTLVLRLGDEDATLLLENGVVRSAAVRAETAPSGPGHLLLRAPDDVWARILAPVPPPMFNDIVPAQAFGLVIEGEQETLWQCYPAVRRAVELLREGRVRG